MKALIKVGYGCNENCTFCHTLEVRHVEGASDEISQKIRRAKELGHSMVVFSGGEPTIRPELPTWAAEAAALGLDTGLVTNGLMLAYPQLLERLLASRLRYVYMSLHGGSAKIHNLLVRANTFDAAAKALPQLAGRGLDVVLNCVVTRQNMAHLKSVVDLVLPYEEFALKFSMVQPKGGGVKHFDQLTPRVSEAAAHVREALSYAYEKAAGMGGSRFRHDGFPLCHLEGFESLYDDLRTHRYWTMVEVGEPDFFPVDDLAKVQPAACEGCALRGACPGLYRGYEEMHGSEELRPVTGRPRSNSFNYVFESLVTSEAGEGCPVLPLGITPFDRGRHLFVRNGPRLARYRTETRDFADVEIDHVKHALGQVYVDASRKVAPDDFARDLVKLRRSGVCAPCPEKERCTGLFEPVFDDVFGRDDALVRKLVGGLEGDVLDVGCGEGPYSELLAPRVRDGRVRYVGIDPDPERIARLRAKWPWARLEIAGAEDLDQEARFDHVLVLRSWNHLRDPADAARRLVRALKPGGSLVVVDNVAFGLARMPAQANRAERSHAMLEHYRNDSASDAERVLSETGLHLVEKHEVSAQTSNQWLLRLVRPQQ